MFSEYFKQLLFTRVKNTEEYSVYAAKIESWLGNTDRYVILIVPINLATKDIAYIHDLFWMSLQTRSLTENWKLIPQPFVLHEIYKVNLQVKERTEKETIYNVPLIGGVKYELSLLHNLKKNSKYQYPETITLHQALSTFQCVLKKL